MPFGVLNNLTIFECGWWSIQQTISQDHFCSKGHILLCLEGELYTELEDGRIFTLTEGMSYQVADHAEAHRSSTENGAKLFIVD